MARFGPYLSIMPLDDGFGYGQPESRMPSKCFPIGPDAVETLENRLAGIVGNAGSLVIDADRDKGSDLHRTDFHEAVLGRE
jgi:hypothetical protein